MRCAQSPWRALPLSLSWVIHTGEPSDELFEVDDGWVGAGAILPHHHPNSQVRELKLTEEQPDKSGHGLGRLPSNQNRLMLTKFGPGPMTGDPGMKSWGFSVPSKAFAIFFFSSSGVTLSDSEKTTRRRFYHRYNFIKTPLTASSHRNDLLVNARDKYRKFI